MGKRKLWIVSELFYPVDTSTSYIMTRIAEYMAPHFDIEVLTGPSQYDSLKYDNKPQKEFPFRIHRIEAGNLDKNGLLSRTVRLVWISLSFCWFILRKAKPGEKVFMVTNPAFLIVIMPFLKRVRKFKLDILVHDVFPENLVAAGVMRKKNLFYSLVKKVFDRAYSKADKLVVLGIDMKHKLQEKTAKTRNEVHIVQNWADLEAIRIMPFETNDIIRKHDLSDKIILAFAGNIGRVQGIDGLIDLIEEVKNDKLHFLFVGDGAMAGKIQKLSRETSKVTYLGRLPRDQQNEFLNASHIGIVSVNDQMIGLGVPSKSYNILAAGKPILFLGGLDTEIAKMVKENALGWTFEHSQQEHILDFLNCLAPDHPFFMSDASFRIRKFASENCSETKMLDKLKQVIEA